MTTETHDAFELRGRIAAVLIAPDPDSHVARIQPAIYCIIDNGILYDRHAGERTVDVREKDLKEFGVAKGSKVANHRQFSAISKEELVVIERALGVPNPMPYGLLGENIVIEGIPNFSQLPTGTKLFFEGPRGDGTRAVLVVWGENMPCTKPGEAIQKEYPHVPDVVSRFPKAALGKRGVVGSVYISGVIRPGDYVVARVPRQKIYEKPE